MLRQTAIAVFFGGCILTACHNQESHNSGEVEHAYILSIDADESKNLKVDKFFKSVSMIRLETNDSCLLGNIHKAILNNENIYFLSKGNTNGVYQFDLDGEYIMKYGKKGSGPNEYGYIQSFTLADKNVVMLDDVNRVLMEYDDEGRFKNRRQIDRFALDIRYDQQNEQYLLYSGYSISHKNKHRFHILDNTLTVKKSCFYVDQIQSEFLAFIPQNTFTKNYFLEPVSDTNIIY